MYPDESRLILPIIKFLYCTVWDRSKEASVPKITSIRPLVSIE